MSLFDMFRLQRIDLNEVKGCGELAAFSEKGQILQELATQVIDYVLFISNLFSVGLDADCNAGVVDRSGPSGRWLLV